MITKQRWVLFFTWFMMIFCFVTWSKVLLLNEHSDAIKLKFEIPHYEIGSKIIDGKRYNSIIDRSEPSTNDKGFPEVPYYTQSIIIGDNSVSDIEVINIEFTEIKISRLVPSRGQIKRNQDPNTIPFTLGKIYTQNIWYPEKNVTITEPFIFRDVRGVTVTFNPFQYNAVLGIL
ncbi:MAG: C25 family peptidase propeptide domain-containing protein, partial [Chitinispirillia bacterium]